MAESSRSISRKFGVLNVRYWEKRTLGDQREGFNFDLHIIRIARPRYQPKKGVNHVTG
jgi:hypothetical protein